MSRIEDIHTSMWSDPDFEVLGRDASLLLIWSWTNTRCGMAGLYKVSKRAMTESKVELEDLDDALGELREASMAFYEQNVLWVRARVKRLRTKTENIAKAIKKDVGLIAPDHPLRVAFIAEYADMPWLRDQLATLTGPSGDPHGGFTAFGSAKGNPGYVGEGHPTLQGKDNGKGKGKGSSSDRRARSMADWKAWAERNLPDLPATLVIQAAFSLAASGADVTIESVTARLEKTHPAFLGLASLEESAGLTELNDGNERAA